MDNFQSHGRAHHWCCDQSVQFETFLRKMSDWWSESRRRSQLDPYDVYSVSTGCRPGVWSGPASCTVVWRSSFQRGKTRIAHRKTLACNWQENTSWISVYWSRDPVCCQGVCMYCYRCDSQTVTLGIPQRSSRPGSSSCDCRHLGRGTEME